MRPIVEDRFSTIAPKYRNGKRMQFYSDNKLSQYTGFYSEKTTITFSAKS